MSQTEPENMSAETNPGAHTPQALPVPGLHAPVTIVIDTHGVPHIRAASARDAYFAQGFAAARDRLWQLDLWRKRGLGLLAADFGPGYLAQDRAARLFLYRGDMAAEWAAYGPQDTQGIVAAFVAGINAWVARVRAGHEALPVEFARLGTRPALWKAEDVVRIRSHALGRNLPSEIARAMMFAAGGDAGVDMLRRNLEPAHQPTVPDGLDVGDVTADVLHAFLLATAAVTFDAARLKATLADATAWSRVDAAGEVLRSAAAEGSNNWAVAPWRTGTGRAVLAGDPHRGYQAPSLRYVVHLQAPGLNVIGAGEPMLPGVSLGHNDHVAFSLTTFPMDQEDLYVYELHPEDTNRYRRAGGWEPMETITERFEVKGYPEQAHALQFTRHGPVLHVDSGTRRAFAVRTVWNEPGSAAYLSSLAYQACHDVADFGKALRHWSVPANNHVVADVRGGIGWFTAGKAPLRSGWDGLLPVPGDGRYEWRGFHAHDVLPRSVNPASGFVYSANEMNLPPGPAQALGVGFEWNESFRARRIREVLAAQAVHGLADSVALQADTVSLPARALCGLLAAMDPGSDGKLAQALAMLGRWDHRLDASSAPAFLFETWWMHHLRPALLDKAANGNARIRALLGPGDLESLVRHVQARAGDATTAACLQSTLSAAMAQCGDPRAWAWGNAHHGYFPHALEDLAPETRVNAGKVPIGGSGATVMNTQYRLGDGRATIGASFRMVLDVGAWDECRFVNAPGQSGDPRSPFYGDQVGAWARGGHFPLYFSNEAIDAHAQVVLRLAPA